MLFISAIPGDVAADSPTTTGAILWLVDAPDTEQADEVIAGLQQALGTEGDAHLFGDAALRARVGDHHRSWSDCALGQNRCGPPVSMAFEALELGLVIRLELQDDGDTIKIKYEMVDRRGEVADRGEVSAGDKRGGGFAVVGQLFDAVGVVSFESTPSEAVVEIDGEQVGQTPLSRQLGLGSYDYQIHLPSYETATGRVEVGAGEAHHVEVELAARPGSLRVTGAPEGALLWIDDEVRGGAHEVIDLPPGHHVIEVRAEDYETYQRAVDIEPGRLKDIEVDMRTMPTFLRDVSASAIADHRYQLEVGIEVGRQRAEHFSAQGTIEGDQVRFERWNVDDEPVGEQGRGIVFSPYGIRVGAGWEGDLLGVQYLSLTLGTAGLNQAMEVRSPRDGVTVSATATQLRTVQVRPMQARVRFFYENLAPFAQAGLGVGFHWLDVRISEERELRLRQAQAFGALELGVRYHFDPRWSVGTRVQLQHYFGDSMGLERVVGVSVGTGLRALPGTEAQPPGEL